MIFVDSNVPMYLVGSPHPNKIAAEHAIATLIARQEKLVTNTEVFQEILHRYAAIGRLDAIQAAFDAVLGLIDEVFPTELENVEREDDPAWEVPVIGQGCDSRSGDGTARDTANPLV